MLPRAEYGLFTEHLLAACAAASPATTAGLRIFDLFEYLQPRVTQAHPRQHPIFKAELEENFPVALYRGGARGTVPQAGVGFRYDAYISYVDREPDATYDWDTLVPRLEQAGLKIAVSNDSQDPGVARVVGVERGIRESERTVVVLSEVYLPTTWPTSRTSSAQTMGDPGGDVPVAAGEDCGDRRRPAADAAGHCRRRSTLMPDLGDGPSGSSSVW